MKTPRVLVFAGSARRESLNKKLARVAAQAVQMKRLIFTRPTGTPTFLATS